MTLQNCSVGFQPFFLFQFIERGMLKNIVLVSNNKQLTFNYQFCNVAVRCYPRNLNRTARWMFNRTIELQIFATNAEIFVLGRNNGLIQMWIVAYFLWHRIAIQFNEEEWNIKR